MEAYELGENLPFRLIRDALRCFFLLVLEHGALACEVRVFHGPFWMGDVYVRGPWVDRPG